MSYTDVLQSYLWFLAALDQILHLFLHIEERPEASPVNKTYCIAQSKFMTYGSYNIPCQINAKLDFDDTRAIVLVLWRKQPTSNLNVICHMASEL